MSRELINFDLAQVARAIAKREVSSVEATQACFAQIRVWQPEINAFIRLDMADALRVAAERDAEIARGQSRGPLHGVPLAHKDLFYRRGRVTTAGSKILEHFSGRLNREGLNEAASAASAARSRWSPPV
jgi:aspartyl-tRNA(Asn)/glutamyl-tRNA(Gln) amidotransferase subunit A